MSHFNYLRITLDKHLYWRYQIDMIPLTISKIIGIINPLKFLLQYFAHGELGRRISKTAKMGKTLDHTEPLFKTYNLLKLKDIYL